jgi:hypothetical protein
MTDEPTEGSLRREIYLHDLKCSFCTKAGTDVEAIVCGATPDIAICNECVDLCRQIMDEARGGSRPAA